MTKNMTFINLLPLTTERLIIRKTSLDDVDLLLKMDKQPDTQMFLGGIKNKTREERLNFIKNKIAKFDIGLAGQLTVCLNDGTPIGLIGLSIIEEKDYGSLGYIFDHDYCNKGYCTEASRKLIEIGFDILKLKYIHAETIQGNNSSIRVLEKLGFEYQGYNVKDGANFLNYIVYNK